jgi:hypothetical protein
MRDRKL